MLGDRKAPRSTVARDGYLEGPIETRNVIPKNRPKMKSPSKLTSLLVGGSLALLPLPMWAQNSPASPGSAPAGGTSTAKPSTPDPQKPGSPMSDPSKRPLNPTASGAPGASVDQKNGSGLQPGAANSGSGVGGRETIAPNANSPADKTGAHLGTSPTSPWAGQFSTMDKDRDGRISSAEFMAPNAGMRSGSTAPGAPGARDATGRPSSEGTSPNAGNTGMKAGVNSVPTNAQVFKQVDTNRDGYLSPAELDAYRMPKASEE